MRTLRYSTAVWVPSVRVAAVEEHIDALTKKCGGVTEASGYGMWQDEPGNTTEEPVRIYEWWWHSPPDAEPLIRALLEAGEECVMVRVTGSSWYPQPVVLLFTEEDYK